MELNNKNDLKAILAESDMQGLNDQGEFESFSVFEGVNKMTSWKIFKAIRENLRIHLNDQQFANGHIEITALEMIQVCMKDIDMHTTAETLHFVWEVGRVYQETRMKLEVLKEWDESQAKEAEQVKDALPELEEGSILQVAKALDKQIFDITEMVHQLPIPQFWPELKEWTADYNNRLETIRVLITKLY